MSYYVMTKVAAGDWLLPSDDAQTLWRITRDEGEGWSLWRYAGEVSDYRGDELEDWSKWTLTESWFRTRALAVIAAEKASRS